MTGPADWVREPFPDGNGTWTNLKRLTDGRVLCQLCFAYVTIDELHEMKPGVRTDVCRLCANDENQRLHERRLRTGPGHDPS